MVDSTDQSDRILREARSSLQMQREGGYHRRGGGSIGEGSRRVKKSNRMKRLKLFFGTVFAILAGASIFGVFIEALGFGGVMIVALMIVAAVFIFSNFPKVRAPKLPDLKRVQDAKQLVARTEIWLEHQREKLPEASARLVHSMGSQLDALGQQLAHIDPEHQAAGEVRRLVGEILPETIQTYLRIPANLRSEERAGATPDAQLERSLKKISKELDSVTRQLAEGSLDDLAIKDRYLDYRYGDAEGNPLDSAADNGVPLNEGSGVPLPDFDTAKSKS
ncbi:hypothetical protein [Aurantiacibacter sp. D1-12]|uniref:hypothetical protein n=1 Tax=Aurantiacibacter sp. D1-12 TaxID=2993658 RepID=UPI00237CDEA0|nr:hypothetical protein [Aurantiacibacter sp. D1-12]MDE1467555.1 hypothetical protein [Aurantiacibacter sp. D1-12]